MNRAAVIQANALALGPPLIQRSTWPTRPHLSLTTPPRIRALECWSGPRSLPSMVVRGPPNVTAQMRAPMVPQTRTKFERLNACPFLSGYVDLQAYHPLPSTCQLELSSRFKRSFNASTPITTPTALLAHSPLTRVVLESFPSFPQNHSPNPSSFLLRIASSLPVRPPPTGLISCRAAVDLFIGISGVVAVGFGMACAPR